MRGVICQIQEEDASYRLNDIKDRFYNRNESQGFEPSLSTISKVLKTGTFILVVLMVIDLVISFKTYFDNILW